MKNILIVAAVAGAVYLLLRRPAVAGVSAANTAGRNIVTTEGRPITLHQGKDGFIYDQYGGMWA